MITVENITKLVEKKLAEGSNFLVDVAVKPGNKIYILLDNDKGLSINDCVEMSKFVESNLDREVEDFEMHVSSPGLDRPLKILRQYQKYIGKQLEIKTKEGEKVIGKLLSATENGISIEAKEKANKGKQLQINTINLTFNQIKETKVILSF